MNQEVSYSVADYIVLLNAKLAGLAASIVGEVSEVKRAASGHVYFTLKDKETGDILPCTIWRTRYAYSGVEIEVGMELLAKGRPEYYGPFGKLSLIADSIELVGEGALLKAYEKLKKKLEAEGIFDQAKKRKIPDYAYKIGLVTSVHGAVIHDFSNNLRKFGFKVQIIDTRVEGPESGKDITLSVRAFRNTDIDVLVLLRGGGSVQSLAGFDNELLVREIAAFPKPVIAGLGHHQDVPLAALAADAMESTPSLVAELLNASWNTAQYSLERSERSILYGFETVLSQNSRKIDGLFLRIERSAQDLLQVYRRTINRIREGATQIAYMIGRQLERIDEVRVRIPARFENRIQQIGSNIDHAARLIETNNPERQLRLGYSLAYSGEKLIRSKDQIQEGDRLDVAFADGRATTIIKELT